MADLTSTLRAVPAAHLGTDIVTAGVAHVLPGTPPTVELRYPYPAATVGAQATAAIHAAVAAAGLPPVEVAVRTAIARRMAQGGVARVPGVRNVIAVASAKGGVGKSVVAANLAVALQAEGARTGLLDADIHGPSVPVLLGGGPAAADADNRLLPHTIHGLQALSMGHLIDPGQAVVWRGPMVIKALRQLVRETAWDDLDFLVLDLPPGTGDVQLSIAQSVPVAGAVIVTTAQELALADAARGVAMFAKVSVPVLGYVANMTTFTCAGCGAAHELFGAGAGRRLERDHGVRLLREIPLDPGLGGPASPTGPRNADFRDLAAIVGAALAARPEDRGAGMPPVVAG